MHQKIPVDFERGEQRGREREGDLSSGSALGLVSEPLSWAAFITRRGAGGRAGGVALNLKRILKGTDDFNIQSQIL